MTTPTTSSVVRAILSADLSLTADQVVAKARTKGLKAPEASIRGLVYNIRGELKRAQAKAVPAAARETTPPKKTATPTTAPTPKPLSAAVPADLSAVLANVALVNAVVGACGGAASARQAAEAVRACGGVDAFLLHLDLVAGIRAADTTA